MTRQCAGCPAGRVASRCGCRRTSGPFRIIKIFSPNEPWCLLPVISHHRRFRTFPRSSCPIRAVRALMSPSLVDIFEEDPVVEAAALGALAARFRHDVLPAHAMGRGESLGTLDALAGTARRAPHRLAPSPALDPDQPARPGPRPPASDAGPAPHRGHRDDPALDTPVSTISR